MHLPLEVVALLAPLALGSPLPPTPSPNRQFHSVPLYRNPEHPLSKRSTGADLLQYTQREAKKLRSKYGQHDRLEHRANSDMVEVLSNLNRDSEYFGTLAIGTPPQNYSVCIDTGSSDLWLSERDCSTCDSDTDVYTASQSTTANITESPFSIVYGSGTASGVVAYDNVTFAGVTAENQAFGLCDNVTQSLISGPVSGLLGFGFEPLASTNAPPFWQNANISELGFAFSRYLHDSSASQVEPGGYMTINGVNETLFSGNITYHEVTAESYWLIESQGYIVNGTVVSDTASKKVAIDTGTSLLGGPEDGVARVFASIPGAVASTTYNGYYEYPCDSQFNISLSFGSISYPISLQDFNLGYVDKADSFCLAALFVLNQTSPEWLVGASFLKNYYTAFRTTAPPAVGFATLAGSSTELLLTSDAVATSKASLTKIIMAFAIAWAFAQHQY